MKNLTILLLTISFNCPAQQHIKNVLNLEFYLPMEAEKWYNEHYKDNTKSKTYVLSPIYNEASTKSRQIGRLITYFEPSVKNYVLQFQDADGILIREIKYIGDWGYGIHLNVTDSKKGFARLPDGFLKDVAWLQVGDSTNTLNGRVSSFIGEIVSLPSVSVYTFSNGEKHTLKRGTYVVEKYQDNSFIIRKEVPGDTPYGEEDEKVNLNIIPRYRLPINNIKAEEGGISISIANPKGC